MGDSVLTIDKKFIQSIDNNVALKFKQVKSLEYYCNKATVLGSDIAIRSNHLAIEYVKSNTDDETKIIVSDLPIVLVNNVEYSNGLFAKTLFKSIELANTKIISDNTRYMFKSSWAKMIDIRGMDVSSVTDLSKTFCFSRAQTIYMDDIIGKSVNNLIRMCYNCDNLDFISLEKSDTSNVKFMTEMFGYCINLKTVVGIENISTENVIDSTGIFEGCSDNFDIYRDKLEVKT